MRKNPGVARKGLTAERIVEAAAAVADRGGLAAVSMRSVAAELGVEAMSLYHHVASKEALLDALIDWVFAQIDVPGDQPWRQAMIARAGSTREVLSRHPWALGMLESRRVPGDALLRHHDAVLGALLAGGFSMRMAMHAFSVLDAYVFGFVLTEVNLPFEPGGGAELEYAAEVESLFTAYPNMGRMAVEVLADGDYEFADEFRYGLDLILDALAARR